MNLLLRSLYLDSQFIRLPLSPLQKVDFIVKKYLNIAKNYVWGLHIGKSHIKVLGQNYYYYDKFGIAFLESVLIENRYLTSYIKPGAVIVDIGAHVGEFHIFCKKILRAAQIISIEPVKESFLLLQKNIGQKPYNYAVSTKKNVIMYTPDTTIMSSSFRGSICQRQEECRGIFLDNLAEIRNLKNIDVVKIDVEGAEYDVLRTTKKTLTKTKYLFIEVSIQRPSSGNLFEILDIIKNYCPASKIIHIGRPFSIAGKPICVDILIRCN